MFPNTNSNINETKIVKSETIFQEEEQKKLTLFDVALSQLKFPDAFLKCSEQTLKQKHISLVLDIGALGNSDKSQSSLAVLKKLTGKDSERFNMDICKLIVCGKMLADIKVTDLEEGLQKLFNREDYGDKESSHIINTATNKKTSDIVNNSNNNLAEEYQQQYIQKQQQTNNYEEEEDKNKYEENKYILN